MCGRYYISIEEEELKDILREVQSKVDAAKAVEIKTGEIRPTNLVPVLTKDGFTAMKFGMKRFDIKQKVLNANSETLLDRDMFRPLLLKGQCCLLPASHYFEWLTLPDKTKIKYAFRDPSSPVIYMAGLYRMEAESEHPVFTILTRNAPSHLAMIHDRMPVIFSKADRPQWLKGGGEVQSLLSKAVQDIQAAQMS